ncbi:MAG: hypothetical protein JNL10_01265 [Verrucomicrobiales bacterium]|nr:hypothetical protein [Verrucomicrobiales bacterium]
MKPCRLPSLALAPLALLGAGLALMWAAEPGGPASAPVPVPDGSRSFAQPIRPDPIGTNISASRAFWGAPPPMPHTFAGDRDGRYCLECHARTTRIERRQQAIAPVPHAEYSQCQQCHVNGTDRSGSVFRESLFVGLDYPGKGTRAHPLAPPTMPHKTFMRDNCLSCHGPAGKQRIKTAHPFRSQCQQCHVTDATKNPDRPVPWLELKGAL